MRGWAGLDIGGKNSVLVVLDDQGRLIKQVSIAMTLDGHSELLTTLSTLARRRRDLLPVAVEDPHALVTRCLAEARFPIVPIPPLEVARFRTGGAPAGSKSDGGDARVLAEMLRVRPDGRRPLPSDSREVLALRVLARQYRARRTQRTVLDMQLRAQAAVFYPAAAYALARRPRREMLAALTIAPTPGAALRTRAGRIGDALRASGRTRTVPSAASELLADLRTPFPRLPRLVEQAHGEALADTVELVRCVDASLARLQRSILDQAGAHPAWPVVSSFPSLGRVTGAILLAEIGDDPARFSSARGLLAFAGVAPITMQSGSVLKVRHRRVSNRPLALAVRDWQLPLIANCDHARVMYVERRRIGDRHNAALRRVSAKYLRMLHHCLLTGEPFNESVAWPQAGTDAADDREQGK